MRFALFLRRENRMKTFSGFLVGDGLTASTQGIENSRGSLERCSLHHERLLFDRVTLKFREPKSSCVNAGRSIRRSLGCHQGLLRSSDDWRDLFGAFVADHQQSEAGRFDGSAIYQVSEYPVTTKPGSLKQVFLKAWPDYEVLPDAVRESGTHLQGLEERTKARVPVCDVVRVFQRIRPHREWRVGMMDQREFSDNSCVGKSRLKRLLNFMPSAILHDESSNLDLQFVVSMGLMVSLSISPEDSQTMSSAEQQTIVVIGSGMVGLRFCEQLTAFDERRRYKLVVFCEEARSAYNRVGLFSFTARNGSTESYCWHGEIGTKRLA